MINFAKSKTECDAELNLSHVREHVQNFRHKLFKTQSNIIHVIAILVFKWKPSRELETNDRSTKSLPTSSKNSSSLRQNDFKKMI